MHMTIIAPHAIPEKNFNMRQKYSVKLLIAVDATELIRYATSHVWSVHVAMIYRNTVELKILVEKLTDGYHVVGDKVFRSFINVWVLGVTIGESEEFLHQLGIQHIIVKIHSLN